MPTVHYPVNQDLFTVAFEEAEAAYHQLEESVAEGESVQREIRLFRIRLRLVIGLEYSFNSQYALAKSDITKEAYRQILQCNEAWFALEAVRKLASVLGIDKNTKCPADIFPDTQQALFDAEGILKQANQLLQLEILDRPSRRQKVLSYMDYLDKNIESQALRQLLERATHQMLYNKALDSKQWLAIVYATRNIYVHKGETAAAGSNDYRSKIILLRIAFDYTILLQLKVLAFVCKK